MLRELREEGEELENLSCFGGRSGSSPGVEMTEAELWWGYGARRRWGKDQWLLWLVEELRGGVEWLYSRLASYVPNGCRRRLGRRGVSWR